MIKSTKVYLLLLLLIGYSISYAQISEGGVPPSFEYPDQTKSKKLPSIIQADFDIKTQILIDEEELNEGLVAKPLKIAKILPARLNILEHGEWDTLPNGTNICRLTIKAPGAIAIMLYYDEFHIPDGAKLFIYNENKTHVIGAYTSKTNPNKRKFATEFIEGEQLTLEYAIQKPLEEIIFTHDDEPNIKISHLVYGYNNIKTFDPEEQLKTGYYDRDGHSCMVNINCHEGLDWQDQKKGVAATVAPIPDQPGYLGLCSGSIINNTAEDLVPYYLTAHHCFEDGTLNDMDRTVFYFHYETPECEMLPIAPTDYKTMVGAEILVSSPVNGGSDGQLLKLLDDIPMDYDIYYNGWDRSNTAPESGVCIHHPGADVKKISTFDSPGEEYTWDVGENLGIENAHWNVEFIGTPNGHSVTASGSSGSPLFNQHGLIVGTLTGGGSSCERPYGTNIYGKLHYHWDKYSDASQHFSQYLDPLNKGLETLQGTYLAKDKPRAVFTPSVTELFVFGEVTYKNYSSFGSTYEWTFEGGTPEFSTEKNPPAITYNKVGKFQTKLIINKGTPNQHESTITINVTERGDNPEPPIASFAVNSRVHLSEGFDTAVPPTGWNIEKKGNSHRQWLKGSINRHEFHHIDPNSISSAVIGNDSEEIVDSWLKSDTYTLEDDTYSIEFYAGYNERMLEGASLSLHISTDGENFEEIWSTGTKNIPESSWRWRKHSVDLTKYAGKKVKFGWYYYGKGGDSAGIDAVKLKSLVKPGESIVINVGDYIEPSDLSSGYPVVYEWKTPGGEPETSNEEQPKIRYMNTGTFDITLSVKNLRGENKYTHKDAVTVLDKKPEINIESEGGFQSYPNWGHVIKKGETILYADKSKNYPTKYYWEFEGGSPTSSQKASELVTYPTKGSFNVISSVENTAGKETTTLESFVIVGEQGEIWNIPKGSTGENVYSDGNGGYISGINSNNYKSFAEKFHHPGSYGIIESVKIKFYKKTDSDESLTVSVNQSSMGLPGDVITSIKLPVTNIPLSTESTYEYTTIVFNEPVIVGEEFFIVVSAPEKTDLAIATSEDNEGENTAYVYWKSWFFGNWSTVNDEMNYQLSYNIVPKYTYVELDINKEHFQLKDKETSAKTVSVSSNLSWLVSAPSWINIIEKDNDAFSFEVADNVGDYRNGYISVSTGAVDKKILIEQSTAAPVGLNADILDDEKSVHLAWSNEYPETIRSRMQNSSLDSAEDMGLRATRPISYITDSLKWHNGSISEAYGAAGDPFEFAIQFDAEDIFPFLDFELKAIEVHLSASGKFNLNIYINGEVKYTQSIENPTAGQFNKIELDSPLLLDSSIDNLLLSVQAIEYRGVSFPASIDNGKGQNNGKGNLFRRGNDKWNNITKEVPYMKGSWLIAGIISGNRTIELSYNIYRNNDKIASTEELDYIDTNAPGGTSYYTITGIQKNCTEIESAHSNQVLITTKHPLIVSADNIELYRNEEHPDISDRYSIKGFVDNDNSSYLSKKPKAMIDPIFKPHIGEGRYKDAILVSDGEDRTGKYRFTYIFGDLIIKDTPVSIEKVNKSLIEVYPIITKGVVNITQLEEVMNAQVYNISGKLVWVGKLQAGDNRINISDFPEGVYFVKVGRHVTKIIKTKN